MFDFINVLSATFQTNLFPHFLFPQGLRTGENGAPIVCLALLLDWLPSNIFVVSLTLPPTRPFR